MLPAHFSGQRKRGIFILNNYDKVYGLHLITYSLSILSSTSMDIGKDIRSPFNNDYELSLEFTNTIRGVIVDLPKYTESSRKQRRAESHRTVEKRFRLEMSKQ